MWCFFSCMNLIQKKTKLAVRCDLRTQSINSNCMIMFEGKHQSSHHAIKTLKSLNTTGLLLLSEALCKRPHQNEASDRSGHPMVRKHHKQSDRVGLDGARQGSVCGTSGTFRHTGVLSRVWQGPLCQWLGGWWGSTGSCSCGFFWQPREGLMVQQRVYVCGSAPHSMLLHDLTQSVASGIV